MTSEYLSRLPPQLKLTADHRKGEIELLASEGMPSFGILYEDEYILLVRDRVLFPSGSEGAYLRVINTSELSGGAGTVMIPLWNSHITFVRIFRHATRSWEWEPPRGYLAPGMSEQANAEKEIREELGVATTLITRIGEINPNTGLLTSIIGVYAVELAADPVAVGKPQTEEGIATFRSVPRDHIMDFVAQHGVRCGISLAAIFLYLNKTLP